MIGWDGTFRPMAGPSPPAHAAAIAASHAASVVLARMADGTWCSCRAAVSGAAAARLVNTTPRDSEENG